MRLKLGLGLALLIIGLSPFLAFAAEELTITTYYPSPYGTYNELRLFPHNTNITACSVNQEGLMYYHLDTTASPQIHELRVCGWNPTTSTYQWMLMGGGFWAASTAVGGTNDIYNTNTRNVGIGVDATTVIGSRLVVEGTTSDATASALNITKADTTSILFARNDGNVGIGTTTPLNRLHVTGPATGAIRIVDGNQGAGKVLTSDANGVGTWTSSGLQLKVTQAYRVNYGAVQVLSGDATAVQAVTPASPVSGWGIQCVNGYQKMGCHIANVNSVTSDLWESADSCITDDEEFAGTAHVSIICAKLE